MDGKGETGGLQRSHGAHPERTGQAQNGRVNLPASRKREFSPVNVGKRETAIERLCMETASMAVFAPGIAVLLSLQQLDIRKVNPQIRAYVNHLHIPQPTYFRPNRLRNKQKDLLFQYPVPLYTYF